MMAARVTWSFVDDADWPTWSGRVEVDSPASPSVLSVYRVDVARFEYGKAKAKAVLISGEVGNREERKRRAEHAHFLALRTAEPLLPRRKAAAS